MLREAENLPLKTIVIGWHGEKEGTIWDKIFRATEGKIYKRYEWGINNIKNKDEETTKLYDIVLILINKYFIGSIELE